MNDAPDGIVVIVDEDGKVAWIETDMAHALAKVGLIWRDGSTWRHHSSLDFADYPELVVCDFCHERPVTWSIDATDFIIESAAFASTAGWTACEACGLAVQAGDRAALKQRAMAMLIHEWGQRGYEVLAIHVRDLTEIQDKFWQHYQSIKRYATPYGKEA